ncbi:MAG: TA system VapC family ribonuclease toxin [Pseudonocardia sp.]
MTSLLDGNVLIALAIEEHVHHSAAERWFAGRDGGFASCPITQGTLVRMLVRGGRSGDASVAALLRLISDDRHEYWPDDLSYSEVRMAGVAGHRQVTDAYLAELARAHGGRLATFDRGLAALHSDIAELVETS